MIWILLCLTAICAAFFLFGPLFATRDNRPQLIGLAALTIAGIIGLYGLVGRPELSGQVIQVQTPSPAATAADGPALVAQLKTKLIDSQSKDPQGWILLARSQMQIGQYEEALKSYETLIEIAPEDAAYKNEYEQALAFAQRQTMTESVLSQSPEDQQDMIKAMVAGLGERIYENGGTPEEWTRLLRAREVLGQTEERNQDIIKMKQQYLDQPETIAMILSTDGAQ